MTTSILTIFISVLAMSSTLVSPSITKSDVAAIGTPSSVPLLGEECGGFAYEVQCAEDLKCCPVPYWSDYLTCQIECPELEAESTI